MFIPANFRMRDVALAQGLSLGSYRDRELTLEFVQRGHGPRLQVNYIQVCCVRGEVYQLMTLRTL